ncbi:MAG TPA: hypothetical protein VJQ46_07120 [Gemmatimonadales bacterium]|nr:hypothetical protein [Gemmatimonadales bacterium]
MDPVRLALLAMGSGMAFGLAVVSLTVLGVDLVRPATPPPDLASGPAFYLLMFGTLLGLVLAGAVAWRLLAPVLSTYRRGGLSLVTAMATVLPMLLCMIANQLAGRAGLLALALVALLIAVLLAGWARRAGVGA